MMGTLAGVLASKKIPTRSDRYRADVEGDIENVEGILKITRIRVRYLLHAPRGKADEARQSLDEYLNQCPAAMSVKGAIDLEHSMTVEEMVESA
jgi:organic hydroperoxide reductase OsmC/OhrA